MNLSPSPRASRLFARALLFFLGWMVALADVIAAENPFPIRGLHLSAPAKSDLPQLLSFVREILPRAGVNTLIIEFNFRFDYQSVPGFGDSGAFGKTEVAQLLDACKAAGVMLIPQINCLGHQSWAKANGRLLVRHPEFDETPGKFPGNEGIYCRSYCPRHPEVHTILFKLIDELASACGARAFHVGMDEVFILADPDCPRCKGATAAELFAEEAKRLDDHVKSIGCRTWMWGDRFIDGKSTGLGKWEASENETAGAVDQVPKDIVICDWHYNKAPETGKFFAEKGFDVVECPWRKPAVALAQLGQMRSLRENEKPSVSRHAHGILQTTWCGFSAFDAACRAETKPEKETSATEAAACFKAVFEKAKDPPK